MKTKTNFLISSILLVLSMSVNAGNFSTSPSSTSNLPPITYQVTVHMTPDLAAFQGVLFVGIINEYGKLIGPRQMVDKTGNRPVSFKEQGTLKGTRTAVLYAVPGVNEHLMVNATPDQIMGIFDAGDVYQFNLYPVLVKVPTGVTP